MFWINNFISFPRSKLIDSNAYVEKVVNAPKNPMMRILRTLSGTTVLLNISTKNPIKRDPKRLTAIVPQGNISFDVLFISSDIKNRETAPTLPPNAIYKMCNN